MALPAGLNRARRANRAMLCACAALLVLAAPATGPAAAASLPESAPPTGSARFT